jgi:hypothetical protein
MPPSARMLPLPLSAAPASVHTCTAQHITAALRSCRKHPPTNMQCIMQHSVLRHKRNCRAITHLLCLSLLKHGASNIHAMLLLLMRVRCFRCCTAGQPASLLHASCSLLLLCFELPLQAHLLGRVSCAAQHSTAQQPSIWQQGPGVCKGSPCYLQYVHQVASPQLLLATVNCAHLG